MFGLFSASLDKSRFHQIWCCQWTMLLAAAHPSEVCLQAWTAVTDVKEQDKHTNQPPWQHLKTQLLQSLQALLSLLLQQQPLCFNRYQSGFSREHLKTRSSPRTSQLQSVRLERMTLEFSIQTTWGEYLTQNVWTYDLFNVLIMRCHMLCFQVRQVIISTVMYSYECVSCVLRVCVYVLVCVFSFSPPWLPWLEPHSQNLVRDLVFLATPLVYIYLLLFSQPTYGTVLVRYNVKICEICLKPF